MDTERSIATADDLTETEALELGQRLGAMGTVDVPRLCTTVVEITRGAFLPKNGAEAFAQDCNERIAKLLGEETPPLRKP